MIYTYVAIAMFTGVGLIVATLFLLSAKLLGPNEPRNLVKNSPYESAEQTVGNSRDIDNEYLPFFMLFLPFEVLVVILLIWAPSARKLTLGANAAVMAIAILAGVAAIVGYKIASDKNV